MRAFLLSLLWLLAGPALAQEKLVGTNMDVRTILNFKVPDAAVQKLLPPGFEANPATSGPSAGANLRVTFVDQMAAHDAAGKPTPPVRNLIFGIPVRKPGSESGGLMIFAGLSPAAMRRRTRSRMSLANSASESAIDWPWQTRQRSSSISASAFASCLGFGSWRLAQ